MKKKKKNTLLSCQKDNNHREKGPEMAIMRKVITIGRKVQKLKKTNKHNENNHNEKGPHMKKIKNY